MASESQREESGLTENVLSNRLLSSLYERFPEQFPERTDTPLPLEIQADIPSADDFQKQKMFIESLAKRKMAKTGRRGGKTKGAAIIAARKFMDGKRILYAAPTSEQLDTFWTEITRIFAKAIEQGILYKNETLHIIEVHGTKRRIKAKTAWDADSLRGDYADVLILDEWQLMNEDAWDRVGAPMLLDNNGDAIFLFTIKSIHSRSLSKAKDKRHASKMFADNKADRSGRWETFEWTSHDNPFISKDALADITKDMTTLAYRMEIMAEDVTDAVGALWKRELIEKWRVASAPMVELRNNGDVERVLDLSRIVVAIDPSATSAGDEAGIVGAGRKGHEGYVLADRSVQGSPLVWATAAVNLYHDLKADRIVAEANNGGEMVETVIRQVDPTVPVRLVHASRGKQTRAEPIAALYEKGLIHHVGKFDALEDEQSLWVPGDESPNRMDALVWAMTELMIDNAMPGMFFVGKNKETPNVESRPAPVQLKSAHARYNDRFDRGD